MLGVMRETLLELEASIKGEEDFFSVASTMPLAAFMPSEVTPWLTALRAYSICTSLPLGHLLEDGSLCLEVILIVPRRECGEGERVAVGHLGPAGVV